MKRATAIAVLSLCAGTACESDPPDMRPCQAYIGCAEVVWPDNVAALEGSVGVEGSCWSERDDCRQQCVDGLALQHDEFPAEPACAEWLEDDDEPFVCTDSDRWIFDIQPFEETECSSTLDDIDGQPTSISCTAASEFTWTPAPNLDLVCTYAAFDFVCAGSGPVGSDTWSWEGTGFWTGTSSAEGQITMTIGACETPFEFGLAAY